MPVAPEHPRSSGMAVPWLPLPAILGFTLLGVGGSVLLTYTTFSFAEAERLPTPSDHARVYEARAVAFENPAQRVALIGRALTATQTDVRRAETLESERSASNSEPMLLTDSDRELRGFPGFGNFSG